LGIFIYFSVFATGNVQHDYYQVLVIPVLCLTVALGVVKFFKYIELRWSCRAAQLTTALIAAPMFFFSWQQVRGFYNINHPEYIEAGKAVDQLTPPDAKVIAPAMGDTVFLFQTNRTGWPIGFDTEQKVANGADFYVSTTYDDEARTVEEKYTTVKKTDQYILIDLQKPKN
jgi:hypothetical protein